MVNFVTNNGSLILKDGKLLVGDPSCCCNDDPGYCCYCLGPSYSYETYSEDNAYKTFAGSTPQYGWSCNVSWVGPDGTGIFLPRGQTPPVGSTFINMSCNNGFFQCRLVEAAQNGDAPWSHPINEGSDIGGGTDWVETTSLGKVFGCSTTLTRSECTQCRDSDGTFGGGVQDYCGYFSPITPNTKCCPATSSYEPDNETGCICPL